MPIVVDASAIVELFSMSAGAAHVTEEMQRSDVFAPDLIDPEVCSAIARLERRGTIDGARLMTMVRQLATAPITRVPSQRLIQTAMSFRSRIGTYDAFYVALAHDLACPLLTADRRLTRVRGLGIATILVDTEDEAGED